MRMPFRRAESRSPLDNPNVPVFQALLGMMDGADSTTGVHVSPKRAMHVIAFLACVKLLSETIASLPRNVWQAGPNGGRAAVEDDPRVAQLALSPNPDMTAYTFWAYIVVSMATWGNAFAWIEHDDAGDVAALWPIAPGMIRKHRDGKGPVRWIITYADNSEGWLYDEEVMHFQGIGLSTDAGLSNVDTARQALGIAISAEDYAGRMFQNDGHPGAILTTDKPMSDEQFAAFKARWTASHEGLKNAHKFALLPPGMTYGASGFDPTNLQMVEARKFQVREMARLFRIPPHMIGDLEGSATFASVEQMSIDFVTYTLRPWLVNIEQVVNRKLFGFPADMAAGKFMEHDTSVLLRADSVSRSKIDNVYRLGGIKTANEIRDPLGLPPIEGGDVLWQPVNVQVVGPDGSVTTPGVDTGMADAAAADGGAGADPDTPIGSSMSIERRVVTVGDIEVRELPDGRREYRGDAIRFGEPSENLGGFIEYVDADIEIAGDDVRHLINHDANLVLGRTTSGTTRLERHNGGITTLTDFPDTSYARDLEVSIGRRDVTQMSFGFRIVKRADGSPGDSWDFSTTPATRHLRAIELHDVSTVTFPAYPTTTAEVRSMLRSNGVRAIGPAVIAWDDEAGACDYMDDVSESLPVGFDGEDYAWGYCADVTMTGDAALVAWYAGGECQLYTVPVALDDANGEPYAGDRAEWVAVEWQLVVSTKDDARALRAGLERRAGKSLSAANADHVQAIADAHAAMGEHITSLADAAGLSVSDDTPLESDDSESDRSRRASAIRAARIAAL
jgi:HK97 family phage portal protein/HK97 family phage prohead protease